MLSASFSDFLALQSSSFRILICDTYARQKEKEGTVSKVFVALDRFNDHVPVRFVMAYSSYARRYSSRTKKRRDLSSRTSRSSIFHPLVFTRLTSSIRAGFIVIFVSVGEDK